MAVTLASQIADLECSKGGDEVDDPLTHAFSETEKALTRQLVECIGDLLLKVEILARVVEDSQVDADDWQALARDMQRLNGPGMSFSPEAWLRRWTAKGGGYVQLARQGEDRVKLGGRKAPPDGEALPLSRYGYTRETHQLSGSLESLCESSLGLLGQESSHQKPRRVWAGQLTSGGRMISV